MPLFGDREEFALEFAVDEGLVLGPLLTGQVQGRARVWCGGREIGRFEEPLCWLALIVDELRSVAEGLTQRWDERLAGLGPAARFELLDRFEFDPDDEGWPDPVPLDFRAAFLIHTSEAFDGFKPFLVAEPSGSLQLLWRRNAATSGHRYEPGTSAHEFDPAAFRAVAAEAAAWFEDEERRQAEQWSRTWPRELVAALEPSLHGGVYVFVQRPTGAKHPLAVVVVEEREGTTLVVPEAVARDEGWAVGFRAAWITLRVNSELEAVGLTAVVSTVLALRGLSCNVVAGFSHDHLFVPCDEGERAVEILRCLSRRAREVAP